MSAAIAACVISDDDIDRLVKASDDRYQCGLEKKHSWQGDSSQYNLVTTLTSISEPGGHSPYGKNFVGSLLAQKLSEASKTRHIETLEQNSHWPEKVDEAESSRRIIVSLEAALAPVITTDDEQMLSNVATQINMDLDSMILPRADSQKSIREFDYSKGGDTGFASHNVSHRLNMLHQTCRAGMGFTIVGDPFRPLLNLLTAR